MITLYHSGKYYSGFCNPSGTGTPKRLTDTQHTYAGKKLIVKGLKSSRTANTTAIWVGPQSANGDQQFDIDPSAERTFVAENGMLVDPYDIFVDITTAGDGAWWYVVDPINQPS